MIPRCSNCKYYKDHRCIGKFNTQFRQKYFSCDGWKPDDYTVEYEKKLKMVDEMVDLWVKDDAPDWVKKAVRLEFMKQPISGV